MHTPSGVLKPMMPMQSSIVIGGETPGGRSL
jgi:hypothetical protein